MSIWMSKRNVGCHNRKCGEGCVRRQLSFRVLLPQPKMLPKLVAFNWGSKRGFRDNPGSLRRFEDGGWAPYFCTDTSAEVRDILEAVAARWAIEEHFHDVKEVWGAGQQQVRNVWSNIGCWNLNGWLYTLVELCSWDAAKPLLTDRGDRPWDNPDRRPSHADRKRTIAREMLRIPILAALPRALNKPKFRRLLEHIIALAA